MVCTGQKPYLMARMGIGFVPDDRRVFADLTVGENLEISARNVQEGGWNKDRVYDFFPALGKIDSRRAGFLSGGEQQMLTIARALMTNPDFILLDEPTEGLAPLIVNMLEEQIARLKESGLTVLLAEQNLEVALRLCDRGYVIDNGAIQYHGTRETCTAMKRFGTTRASADRAVRNPIICASESEPMRVTLFVQCLVDSLYPEVGEAMVVLFNRLGLSVTVPGDQTCCGQPAFNAGYRQAAGRRPGDSSKSSRMPT
jgi:ABC-type multidrug transport system ATPase subunit